MAFVSSTWSTYAAAAVYFFETRKLPADADLFILQWAAMYTV